MYTLLYEGHQILAGGRAAVFEAVRLVGDDHLELLVEERFLQHGARRAAQQAVGDDRDTGMGNVSVGMEPRNSYGTFQTKRDVCVRI